MQAIPILLLLLAVTAGLPGVAAEGETVESEAVQLDPVIASVVRMLEEKVPSQTISQWLERFGNAPGTPTPDDLIALTRAGASSDLVGQILRLAEAAEPSPPPPPQREPTHVEPPSPPPSATPSPRRPPLPVKPPAPIVTPSPARPLPPLEAIPARFEVRYSPQIVEYQMTPWDLFVYIDGRPVARGDGWSGHSSKHVDLQKFSLPLAPGRHVIRLLQEQHEVKSKRKGTWSHKARVFGEPIVFDVDAAGDWLVALEVQDRGLSIGERGTRYAIALDGETVVEGAGPGAGSRWPALCEEVETRLSPGESDSKAGRRALKGCVRWASLWEGVKGLDDRAAVREAMQGSGFDPVLTRSR